MKLIVSHKSPERPVVRCQTGRVVDAEVAAGRARQTAIQLVVDLAVERQLVPVRHCPFQLKNLKSMNLKNKH
jgi:hypothetical protein